MFYWPYPYRTLTSLRWSRSMSPSLWRRNMNYLIIHAHGLHVMVCMCHSQDENLILNPFPSHLFFCRNVRKIAYGHLLTHCLSCFSAFFICSFGQMWRLQVAAIGSTPYSFVPAHTHHYILHCTLHVLSDLYTLLSLTWSMFQAL